MKPDFIESSLPIEEVIKRAKACRWKATQQGSTILLSRRYKRGVIQMTLKKDGNGYEHD